MIFGIEWPLNYKTTKSSKPSSCALREQNCQDILPKVVTEALQTFWGFWGSRFFKSTNLKTIFGHFRASFFQLFCGSWVAWQKGFHDHGCACQTSKLMGHTAPGWWVVSTTANKPPLKSCSFEFNGDNHPQKPTQAPAQGWWHLPIQRPTKGCQNGTVDPNGNQPNKMYHDFTLLNDVEWLSPVKFKKSPCISTKGASFFFGTGLKF